MAKSTHRRLDSPTVDRQPYSRERLSLVTLLVMAALGIGLSVFIVGPFIPGLVWALSFAIVISPLHRQVSRAVPRANLAAALSVFVVAAGLVLPAMVVAWQIGQQVTTGLGQIQEHLASGRWTETIDQSPRLSALWQWVTTRVDLEKEVRQLGESFDQRVESWARTLAWAAAQIFVALFALFYLLRDRVEVLAFFRSLLPLSKQEADYLFEQIRAMTHATIYGTVAVAALQGALGGLMFLILGIPGPLLWSVAMGLLAVIPTLGAFIVWVPAAIVLAVQGEWIRALILGVWGTVIVGFIDNLMYPALVGKEARLHTLPIFLAIVGGLVVFGAAGVVLGPVVLAATIAILTILRARTAPARLTAESTQSERPA
jgi:predicted PurR-regulated permease PerM